MLITHKIHQEQFSNLGAIMMLSAWSFVIVIASFLFLYLGHLLDNYLGTSPNFMLGLFFLAIFLSIMRLYQEAWKKIKDI
jgi:F0F1-type ATP synthase assembly protein I